ncbi:MAG: hypothetical protein QW199_00485 [Candidatus Pacearchaeota archaeon]
MKEKLEGKKQEKELIEEEIEEICKKPEFRKLNRAFVLKIALKIVQKFERFERKDKNIKDYIKAVRKFLRKILTPMQPKFYKKFKFFLDNIDKDEIIDAVIKANFAAREREKGYPWLIEFLAKTKPTQIIDFGCGFNLLGLYKYGFDFSQCSYVGYDIDGYITELLEKFAEKKKINAKIINADISSIDFTKFKESKTIYLFLKVLDALEAIEPGFSKKILMLGGTKIVSFSLRSLGGKRHLMERAWFENLLNENKIGYEKIKKGEELFYVFNVN